MARSPAGRIERVIVPLAENPNPVAIVTRLSNVGIVMVGASACSNMTDPGTQYTMRLLAQSD